MTMATPSYHQQSKPICFYDGDCPICKVEIDVLKGLGACPRMEQATENSPDCTCYTLKFVKGNNHSPHLIEKQALIRKTFATLAILGQTPR